MSMWLVFWSEHVCKRCDPTLSSERRAEWLGQRRHSHNYTAPSKWFQHFQRVSKLYFQLAAAFVRLVRHHMNALWLSVTSRETKTKCLHRERTVKLGKEKKKRRSNTSCGCAAFIGKHIGGQRYHLRLFSRWISAGGRDVQLSDSVSLRD